MKINCNSFDLLSEYTQMESDTFLNSTEHIIQEKIKELNLPINSDACEFTLTFFTPSAMSEINSRYRDIATATDVLSFPMWEEQDGTFSPPDDWESLPLGDIVVCPETVEKNAKENAKTFDQELALVVFHGFLHLCGYDHDTEERKSVMWLEQDDMLTSFMETVGYDR